jgi:hypothetical protein
MVIGSDTPKIAIYEDGHVIFLRLVEGKRAQYFHTKLSSEDLAEIIDRLASFGDYPELKPFYRLTSWTDNPTTKVYISIDANLLVTSVYGLSYLYPLQEKWNLEELPKTIEDLHSYLTSLDFPDAKPWSPKYVEVMLWKGAGMGRSAKWPTGWPGLDSPNALQRGRAYSIFLPGEKLPELEALLISDKGIRPVSIDGKRWAVSWRFTFPREPEWFNAFRDLYNKR